MQPGLGVYLSGKNASPACLKSWAQSPALREKKKPNRRLSPKAVAIHTPCSNTGRVSTSSHSCQHFDVANLFKFLLTQWAKTASLLFKCAFLELYRG